MRVPVVCRDCGQGAVDAADVHVLGGCEGFGPSATFLCPGCGAGRPLGVTLVAACQLADGGALVVDPAAPTPRGVLGPEHAVELRELLTGQRWLAAFLTGAGRTRR